MRDFCTKIGCEGDSNLPFVPSMDVIEQLRSGQQLLVDFTLSGNKKTGG